MQHKVNISAPVSLYGLIGKPVGHSKSPALHNFIFSKLEMNALYLPWEIDADQLADFVAGMRSLPIAGVSVTIPHKEKIMDVIDHVSARAGKAGAVNTLYWSGGKIHGDNTDIAGFMAPLAGRHEHLKKAVILGAGGASRAVLVGLCEIFKGEICISARDNRKTAKLADEFGVTAVPWENRGQVGADMVINTTPLGMQGKYQEETAFPLEGFGKSGGLAYDLIYNPPRTLFMIQAEAAGWAVLGGMQMFLAQGVEQIKLWTGKELGVKDLPIADIFDL